MCVYRACQAVKEEQQAQRLLLEDLQKLVTDNVQELAAQKQEKADERAFSEEVMVSCCISSEAREGMLQAIELTYRCHKIGALVYSFETAGHAC